MENVNTRMTKYDTPIKQAIQHLQGRDWIWRFCGGTARSMERRGRFCEVKYWNARVNLRSG